MNSKVIEGLRNGKPVLLFDGGSTKMEWILTSGYHRCGQGLEAGINPLIEGLPPLEAVFQKVKNQLPVEPFAVGYYGAGCTPHICPKIIDSATEIFGCESECGSDLLLAARLLCPQGKGLVCILGTGANSGYFLDGELLNNIPSLGYILGDEGGAVRIGARILADCLRTVADKQTLTLWTEMNISYSQVLEKLYHSQGGQAAFIGSFLKKMAPIFPTSEYLQSVVENEIGLFFTRIVDKYNLEYGSNLYFTGSVAGHFSDIIQKFSDERNLHLKEIIQNPLNKIID